MLQHHNLVGRFRSDPVPHQLEIRLYCVSNNVPAPTHLHLYFSVNISEGNVSNVTRRKEKSSVK